MPRHIKLFEDFSSLSVDLQMCEIMDNHINATESQENLAFVDHNLKERCRFTGITYRVLIGESNTNHQKDFNNRSYFSWSKTISGCLHFAAASLQDYIGESRDSKFPVFSQNTVNGIDCVNFIKHFSGIFNFDTAYAPINEVAEVIAQHSDPILIGHIMIDETGVYFTEQGEDSRSETLLF